MLTVRCRCRAALPHVAIGKAAGEHGVEVVSFQDAQSVSQQRFQLGHRTGQAASLTSQRGDVATDGQGTGWSGPRIPSWSGAPKRTSGASGWRRWRGDHSGWQETVEECLDLRPGSDVRCPQRVRDGLWQVCGPKTASTQVKQHGGTHPPSAGQPG